MGERSRISGEAIGGLGGRKGAVSGAGQPIAERETRCARPVLGLLEQPRVLRAYNIAIRRKWAARSGCQTSCDVEKRSVECAQRRLKSENLRIHTGRVHHGVQPYRGTQVSEPAKEKVPFDFETHRKKAVEQYARHRGRYEDFAWAVRDILADTIESQGLKINEIQCRAKEIESFGKKAMTTNEQNPEEPKYRDPMSNITDLAGVRVITFFPSTVHDVCQLIQEEFDVIERVDHTATAELEQRLGYLSVHYLVRLGGNRRKLSEYRKFEGLIAEVQVRTVLQHAWAEIEHDIRYKSTSTIPQAISRRFMTLAGLLEIADREFEAIQKEDASIRANARTLIEAGRLAEVEVTSDALRAYLDVRLGPDERISDFTYDWTTKMLRLSGFQNIGQIDECIRGLDDDKLSRIALGGRGGQVSRFEVLLAASLGEMFLKNHPWGEHEWYQEMVQQWWEKLKNAGIQVGSHQPRKAE